MKRFILVFVLLAVSAGAKAEWIHVYSNSNGTSYLWNPVERYYPWAYPVGAGVLARSLYVKGWSYRARSTRTHNTVDCRDGRAKLRYGYLFSNANLTGARAKIGYLILSNGLKVVPGRWYAYAQFPYSARKAISMACN